MASDKPIIAIATGDPAGIGPEISLKAALDPAVRAACRPILVSDGTILRRHAQACGIQADLRPVAKVADAGAGGNNIAVFDCPQPETIPLGQTSAAAGRASIAFCRAAVKAALSNEVAAVVAAPQNESS